MLITLILLLFHLTSVFMYRHQKPLEHKLWSERCKRNSVVLNDCNWCWCGPNQRFQCKARVCEEIDMFGHFKDAIQEIDVGMEGRGSWRSKQLSCTPGVHYEREDVLCVCDQDGNWPNPVCRDLFRILHSVELTGQTKLSKNESCMPAKLYLYGCNVCFCPSNGYLSPELCTNRRCYEDDPALEAKDTPGLVIKPQNSSKEVNSLEVYAECDTKQKYKLGCRNCDCLKNNRLLCYNCSSDNKDAKNSSGESLTRRIYKSYCNGKTPGKIFHIGCNSCHCDEKQYLYCTSKRCIQAQFKTKPELQLNKNIKYKEVQAPPDEYSCLPGTQFKKDCNTCSCSKRKNGAKIVNCTLKPCSKTNPINEQQHDCVPGTLYERDCMICSCIQLRSKTKYKIQICQENLECLKDPVPEDKLLKGKGALQALDSLHGYCEPLHRYQKDCNTCRCLSDGKTIKCTSKRCVERTSVHDSLSVDVIPVHMSNSEACPEGQSYTLDCNLCFCLSNGNAICTTNDCSLET